MPRALAETVALLLLAVTLAFAVVRPRGLPGQRMASAARGRPVALLGLVFMVGAAVTAVLSLDATVVLLTPVVFACAVRLRLRPKPQADACTHLANTASLLLPVSNLTNLLAFRANGLSFWTCTSAPLAPTPWWRSAARSTWPTPASCATA